MTNRPIAKNHPLATALFAAFASIRRIAPSHPLSQNVDMAELSAVALREPSAAPAPNQRLTLSHPPTQNVNSAASADLLARQFGG